MKSLVLASILGSAVTAYAVPALAGPIHFQPTKPYSLFGLLPVSGVTPVLTNLGVVPMDFVMTDVLVGVNQAYGLLVTVNGNPVFNLGSTSWSEHLTTGIPVPRGSTIGVQAVTNYVVPVTIVGYVQ